MTEQAPELSRFSWSSEFDPREEEIIDLGPCIVIAKPVRTSKPERDLTALAPRSPQIQKIFSLKDMYKMRVDPRGVAGSHLHQKKVEIVFPIDNVELFFHLPERGETLGISVAERIGNTSFGFLIKPGVVHAIKNPSEDKDAFYIVLSNMFEEDALAAGDVISFSFHKPNPQPLHSLLTFPNQLK